MSDEPVETLGGQLGIQRDDEPSGLEDSQIGGRQPPRSGQADADGFAWDHPEAPQVVREPVRRASQLGVGPRLVVLTDRDGAAGLRREAVEALMNHLHPRLAHLPPSGSRRCGNCSGRSLRGRDGTINCGQSPDGGATRVADARLGEVRLRVREAAVHVRPAACKHDARSLPRTRAVRREGVAHDMALVVAEQLHEGPRRLALFRIEKKLKNASPEQEIGRINRVLALVEAQQYATGMDAADFAADNLFGALGITTSVRSAGQSGTRHTSSCTRRSTSRAMAPPRPPSSWNSSFRRSKHPLERGPLPQSRVIAAELRKRAEHVDVRDPMRRVTDADVGAGEVVAEEVVASIQRQ